MESSLGVALPTFGAVLFAFFAFYTGYSKESKSLKPSQLYDVIFFRKGIDHTLAEMNKIVALAGLTCLCLPFVSFASNALEGAAKGSAMELAYISTTMLWGHTCYSAFKFYGSKNIPPIGSWPHLLVSNQTKSKGRMERLRLLSILFGTIGQCAISAVYFGYFPASNLSPVCVGLFWGLLHFWTMEVDFKGVLQVRPFAYLAVALPAFAIVAHVATQMTAL